MATQVLVTDDDADACELVGEALRARGWDVLLETRPERAAELGKSPDVGVVVTDLHMDGLDGLALCRQLVDARPGLAVIVITGDARQAAAVGALRAGAYDFVTKPVDTELLAAAVKRAVQTTQLRAEVERLEAAAGTARGVRGVIGESGAMRRVFDAVGRIAATDATVLVTGESGTGKERIANALHAQSRRAAGPFVPIHCAAVPAALLESELFGHAKGAFTDAKTARRGLFLEANGGTLFLDEIGEMPLDMQVKLLRALQERTVRPVGGGTELPFDARIVAATHRDLETEVAEKRFRQDLYYRIHVCEIALPPLREREGDVALLAPSFAARFAERQGKRLAGIAPDALEKLVAYAWPGNVRELENALESAVAMARGERVALGDLPARVRSARDADGTDGMPATVDAVVPVDVLERRYIHHVLALVGGNKSRAARLLGYDRRTLYRKLGRD